METNSQIKVNQLLAQKKSIWKWTRQIKNSKVDVHKLKPIQWNLGTFPSVRLIEGVHLIEFVKIAQCLLTINIQRLLCTMINFHVVKEVIQSSSSLPFISNFNLFVNAKNTNWLQYVFQGRNPMLLLSIQSGVRLIEVFNHRNYSQLSPCGHPTITDIPIKRTVAKSQAKTNYRRLTEINSRYYGLSLMRTLTRGPCSVRCKGSWL